MSDAQHTEAHEGPIKSVKQLVTAVIAAFMLPVIAIILLANYVDFGGKKGAGSDSLSAEQVALRLQPVGNVAFKEAGSGALRTGEQLYTEKCAACHAAGALGAPKFGDAGAWGPRIGKGYDTLLTHAAKGFNAMPAQAAADTQEVELGRAVVYMANKAGASFAEPKAPEAAASK